MQLTPPPGAPAALPPQGGAASGPAEPVPRRPLDEAAALRAAAAARLPTSLHPLGARLLAAALALPAVGPALAESAPERGVVSVKFLDYLDWQPAKDRVRVRAPSLHAMLPLSSRWSVAGTLIHDSISGASPAFHTSALKKLTDERQAADVEATRWFADGSLKLGASFSTENDYVSRALALTATRSSEDKNRTWTAGLAWSHDAINPTTKSVERERKRVADILVGLTQVMGRHDLVQFNLAWRAGQGYFSDPYKVFDQRPRTRNSGTALARWNHHFERTEGTLRTSWRYFADTYGIRSHTLSAEYVQPLPGGWSVTPLLRLYTQSAARFYVEAESGSPFPPNPPEGAIHSSEDQRVSAFGARTWGLKVARQFGNDWLVDLKYERYGQRGSWRWFGQGSEGLEPFNARSVQVGVSRQF